MVWRPKHTHTHNQCVFWWINQRRWYRNWWNIHSSCFFFVCLFLNFSLHMRVWHVSSPTCRMWTRNIWSYWKVLIDCSNVVSRTSHINDIASVKSIAIWKGWLLDCCHILICYCFFYFSFLFICQRIHMQLYYIYVVVVVVHAHDRWRWPQPLRISCTRHIMILTHTQLHNLSDSISIWRIITCCSLEHLLLHAHRDACIYKYGHNAQHAVALMHTA